MKIKFCNIATININSKSNNNNNNEKHVERYLYTQIV